MKIVCMDGGLLNPGDVSWQPMRDLGNFEVYKATEKRDFANRAHDADVILVNKTPVFKEEIAALIRCRLVGALATGTNNLDLPALADAGIKVCNVPAYGPDDIAQHALALLLELTRDITGHSQSIKAGKWTRHGEWAYWLKAPLSLVGLTIGIIGFGTIGQIMGRLANACGMKVLAYSPRRSAKTDYPFTWASLDEIWENSNVISLHCPLVPATKNIINKDSISAMREGTIIINTARGGLVDEEAAANALLGGKLGALGTDVLSVEPPTPDNPLLAAPRTLITPHMAWATARSRQNIIDIMAENIQAFFSGKAQNLVN